MSHTRLTPMVSAVALVLQCLVAFGAGIRVEVTRLEPTGVRFHIPDEGYGLVALHFSVNKPLSGVGAGDVSVDIAKSSGSSFDYENRNIQLKPGDKVNYWVNVIQNGLGKNLLDQSYTVRDPTTISTTTTTTTTTTSPTRTTTPSKTATTEEGEGVFIESETTKPPAPGVETGPDTHTAGGMAEEGTGNCGCGAIVQRDGYNKEASCTSYPCLIFEDEFDKLDAKLWEHEITAGGGGNWEFQYYNNNRSNSYVRDGKLFIKPTLATDQWGPDYPEHGKLNLWGSHPASVCTGNDFYGCERQGMPGQVVSPIQSARLRSSRSFNFKYGRMEVEAKMPSGDWIWPAIWLLPRWNAYGNWPASGEIDLVESRGNLHYKDDKGQPAGADSVGSTLHFGPFVAANQWPKAHGTMTAPSGTFADSFHKYTLDWDESGIRCSVDGKEILNVSPPTGGFWEFGDFEKDGKSQWDNPWAAGSRMAPFDQEFFIILNVAVGGVGFFPDNYVNSPYPKPWQDKVGHAATAFWNARGQWLPTWHVDQNNGEGAAMQVNYIKVWKMRP